MLGFLQGLIEWAITSPTHLALPVLTYLCLYPLVLLSWRIAGIAIAWRVEAFVAHKRESYTGRRRTQAQTAQRTPLVTLLKQHIAFVKRDTRSLLIRNFSTGPVKRKHMYYGMHAFACLLVVLVTYAMYDPAPAWWWRTLAGIAMATTVNLAVPIPMVTAYMLARKGIAERQSVTKMLIKRTKRTPGPVDDETPIEETNKVLEWGEDQITPTKVQVGLPPDYDDGNRREVESVINRCMKGDRVWVVDRTDPENPGWDYENSTITLVAKPPLPTLAPFSEHYFGDLVPPDWFSLAIGVEDGILLPNPHTGVDEHVLGYMVHSGARDYAEEAGIWMAPGLPPAPHALIGGSTGGGKALALDTPILISVPYDMAPPENPLYTFTDDTPISVHIDIPEDAASLPPLTILTASTS